MNLNKIYSIAVRNNSKETIKEIENLLEEKEYKKLNAIIENLNQVEITDMVLLVDFDLLPDFIKCLETRIDHHMIPNFDNERATTIFKSLGVEKFAELINKFEEYEFYDFIHHHQDFDDYESLYENLEEKKQDILDEFLSYPKNTAGRLMQRNILYASMEWNVRQIKDFIHYSPNVSTNIERIFLIDIDKKIHGSISLARLLKTNPDTVAKDVMNVRFTVVKFDESQKKIVQLFQRHSLSYILVADSENAVMGVITADDVMDVLETQVDQNFIRSQYITSSDNLLQNKNFLSSVGVRLPWLIINIILSTLVSAFVAMFTDLFTTHIELTIIIPIIASISSISGAQTIATTIHTLAKSEVQAKDILRTFSHEIFVSISVAVLISIISSVTVYFRFGKQVSILYSLAMFLDFCVASMSGIFIPLLTYFVFKWDPAIISPILVTTISDFAAYFFAIVLALWLLS